jgi:hypothetical protein
VESVEAAGAEQEARGGDDGHESATTMSEVR